MLPLRLGARSTQIVLRTAEGVAGRAATGALQIIGAVKPNGGSSSSQETQAPTRPSSNGESEAGAAPQANAVAEPTGPTRGAVTMPPDRDAPVVSAPQPEVVEPQIAPEPVHVSEEPELVREEAEPGAEDGAGATVRVQPPWEGYQHMGAREVIARLGDASAAELAAVELYERSNRSRQTVLEAVERRLKAANGKG